MTDNTLVCGRFLIRLHGVFVHLGRPGLICLELHPAIAAGWQSLRVCVGCVTVISHQSEAAEPHIDILDCLTACVPFRPPACPAKNRYVKRQALSSQFFFSFLPFPTHSLSEPAEAEGEGLCQPWMGKRRKDV